MRALLVPVLVLACNGGGAKPKPSEATPPAVRTPDAAAAPVAAATDAAPMTWRGPNLYALVDGDVTVAVTLKPPDTWTEDWTDDHELLTSPAGSAMKVTLVRGDPPADFTELRPGVYRHGGGANAVWLHRVTVPAGTWFARCELSIVDADAALLPELTRQCDALPYQQEPDPRIEWTIELRPAKVALAKLASVTVRYTATNRSKAPVDAKAYNLEYLVDGEVSMTLGMAFGNGGFESIWRKLPPGKTVDDERTGMADLVATPGDHVFTLTHLDREVARATLHVTK